MGTHTDFFVANHCLISTKGDVIPVVMTIFRESDKRIYQRRFYERKQLPESETVDDEDIVTAYEYTATISNIKDRLDVMGFSLERTKDEFYEGINTEIESLREMIESSEVDEPTSLSIDDWKENYDLLKGTTFEDWLAAFAYIAHRDVESELTEEDFTKEESPLIRYILDSNDLEYVYHFPCSDLRHLIRAFIEACPDDALVSQDITELVQEEFYDPDDPVCKLSLDLLTRDYPINEKTIILTEGSTDVFILKESLATLYPHLVDYFSFMDFGVSNAAGGASFLVSTVKAFIGSGIRNRVIGIFDNDTAAKASIKAFERINIPDNIMILTYPSLDLAKHYPTIGPSGVSELDINGLAGSIELYLGIDVLTTNGQLTPIQWKGYDAGVGQYQGEILNKKALQDAFFEKVKRCKSDPALIAQSDWEAMRLLLQEIFHAFR